LPVLVTVRDARSSLPTSTPSLSRRDDGGGDVGRLGRRQADPGDGRALRQL
jgi:hypothetical protein